MNKTKGVNQEDEPERVDAPLGYDNRNVTYNLPPTSAIGIAVACLKLSFNPARW
jgi:hypothetical protein